MSCPHSVKRNASPTTCASCAIDRGEFPRPVCYGVTLVDADALIEAIARRTRKVKSIVDEVMT